jgi:hypothetical protein
MGVGGQRHAAAALPPGMTRYALYRRLGRPQGRSGRVLKILPPQEFDPRTVQLVASRYTDYAIPAHPVYMDNLFSGLLRFRCILFKHHICFTFFKFFGIYPQIYVQ